MALAFQAHRRPQTGFEGLALKGAPAEAMDCGDVGTIEPFEGQKQAAFHGPMQGLALGCDPFLERAIHGFSVCSLQQG